MKFVRRLIIVVLSLIIIGLLSFKFLLTTKCGTEIRPVMETNWFACATNVDCTTVLGYCAWETVNTKNKANMQQFLTNKYNLGLIEYDCPQSFKDTPQPIAQCVNYRCTIPGSTN